jgi:hypothetical protein
MGNPQLLEIFSFEEKMSTLKSKRNLTPKWLIKAKIDVQMESIQIVKDMKNHKNKS